jgi:hypothetical protein
MVTQRDYTKINDPKIERVKKNDKEFEPINENCFISIDK